LHPFGEKYMSLRDFSHKELYDNQKSLSGDSKTETSISGSLSKTLTEIGKCLGIFKTQRLDATTVIQVATQLIVRGRIGEGRIAQELMSLFDCNQSDERRGLANNGMVLTTYFEND